MAQISDEWLEISALVSEALPEFDNLLSQWNVPLAQRKGKAFNLLRKTMIETSDEEAFLVSEAHGRFLIIIEEWYRKRYGDSVKIDQGQSLTAAVMIHNTPFPYIVPRNFKTPPDDEFCIWIGFPASVQAEEDPLIWLENQAVLEALDTAEHDSARETITETANLIRSIGFDLRALAYDTNTDVADLSGAIESDLQASAGHLCEQSSAGLRSAAWDISQATEKSLKLFVRKKGELAPHTHDLEALTEKAEALGASPIDREKLKTIPSKRDATNMRYGGSISLSGAYGAYRAGLHIIRQVLFDAMADAKVNARELRIQMRRPPWFDFDVEGFIAELRTEDERLSETASS